MEKANATKLVEANRSLGLIVDYNPMFTLRSFEKETSRSFWLLRLDRISRSSRTIAAKNACHCVRFKADTGTDGRSLFLHSQLLIAASVNNGFVDTPCDYSSPTALCSTFLLFIFPSCSSVTDRIANVKNSVNKFRIIESVTTFRLNRRITEGS